MSVKADLAGGLVHSAGGHPHKDVVLQTDRDAMLPRSRLTNEVDEIVKEEVKKEDSVKPQDETEETPEEEEKTFLGETRPQRLLRFLRILDLFVPVLRFLMVFSPLQASICRHQAEGLH